ncbi:MAG: lipoprotein [Gammaproteobacteria bacterium]|nr:MAG: lipoprotein [Gammaproteobacteria bacterium]
MLNTKAVKTVSVVLAASLLFTACNVNPPRGDGSSATPLTPAEDKLRAEADSVNKSGLQACLISGGVAGLGTYLLSKDKSKAIAAAVIGCGVGVGANYYLQNKRQQYAGNEERLKTMMADIREDNARLSRIIQSAEEVVSEDKQRIDEIDKAYREKKITMQQAQDKMKSVDDNKEYLEQTLANLRKREAEWQKVAAEERKVQSSDGMIEMDKEISQLQGQIASLEGDLEILVNRRSISPIG